jgi:beta-lactam-binding protein with PASTA domain
MRGQLIARGAAIGVAAVALAACGSSDSPDASEPSASAKPAASSPQSDAESHAGHQRQIAVPKIVGKSFDAAMSDLRRAGLNHQSPGFTGTVSNPRNEGSCLEILRQAPPAGTKVPVGDTVSIVFGACRSAIIAGRTEEHR